MRNKVAMNFADVENPPYKTTGEPLFYSGATLLIISFFSKKPYGYKPKQQVRFDFKVSDRWSVGIMSANFNGLDDALIRLSLSFLII